MLFLNSLICFSFVLNCVTLILLVVVYLENRQNNKIIQNLGEYKKFSKEQSFSLKRIEREVQKNTDKWLALDVKVKPLELPLSDNINNNNYKGF